MNKDTWQPNNLNLTADSNCIPHAQSGGVNVPSAQVSDDGKTVVVRVVNKGDAGIVIINGLTGVSTASQTSISWPDTAGANTPSEPTKISPKNTTLSVLGILNGKGSFQLAANSFTVFEFQLVG